MGSVGTIDRQLSRMVVALALVAAMIISSFLPALAWAAQVTERSIQLSSSTKSAASVSYKVQFTPVASAGAILVDFCSNSPLIGSTCTAPTGMSATSAASTSAGVTAVAGSTSKFIVSIPMSGGTPVSVDVTGITNPSGVGTMYGRILTYADATAAAGYTTNGTVLGSSVDSGSVALSITENVNISAAVLETMTFCVASISITDNCANAAANPPTIEIGETTGSVKALSTSTVSTGDIFTQLSTNASGGAVIRLKSAATGCGGMKLVGGPNGNCYITPATADFGSNTPRFGLKVAAGTDGTSPNGTIQAANGYNATTYLLNYDAVDESDGVTSTYGDEIINTDGAPVNHKAMKLTFGAGINNQTPAGKYTADLSLIATGTF